MALWDIFKTNRHNGDRHEANNLLRTQGGGFYYARRKYSDVYLWLVLNKIFAGMRSVIFYNSNAVANEKVDALCNFVMSNAEALVWQYYDKGYMVLDVTRTDEPRLVMSPERDNGGHISEPRERRYSVVYSNEYSMQRLSAFQILHNNFDEIDTLRSADRYLTESLGAVGIISGREMPMTAREKEDFLRDVKAKMGITPDKFQFLIATGQVSYTPIAIPVSDLRLSDKVTSELKLICDYFNVPFDIINFSGASTYANMAEAVRLFYANCISPLAEQLLLLIRHAIKIDTTLMVLSERVTFRIDNSDFSDRQQAATLANTAAVADLITKADSLDADTTKIKQRLNEVLKNIEI